MTAHQLQELGQRISRGGYSFELFQESTALYWKLILNEAIRFGPETIEFAEANTLERLIPEKRDRELKKLYSLLPLSLTGKYSFEDVEYFYFKSMSGLREIKALLGARPVGHYNEVTDKCYVLPAHQSWEEPSHDLTGVVVHEIAHRYLHHKRAALPELTDQVYGVDGLTEERFCKQLEASFRSYLFYTGPGIQAAENLAASQSLLLPDLKSLTNPPAIKKMTQHKVELLTSILQQARDD